jgi:hypothetical protein
MIAYYLEKGRSLKADLLEYLWTFRDAPTEKGGRLSSQAVCNRFSSYNLTRTTLSDLRPEFLDESAAQPIEDCPYAIAIENYTLRLKFLDKRSFKKREMELDDLADYEHTGPGGYLSSESEILIYIHQGSGIADRLPKLMLANMQRGVRYRYFMPVEFAKHAAELIGELLSKMDAEPKDIIPQFRSGLEINLMAHRFPFFFSVHNASNQKTARLYLRSLTAKDVVLYSKGKEAYDSAQSFEELAEATIRDDDPPVILPCQNVTVSETTWRLLRLNLNQRLERLGVPESQRPELIGHLMQQSAPVGLGLRP